MVMSSNDIGELKKEITQIIAHTKNKTVSIYVIQFKLVVHHN